MTTGRINQITIFASSCAESTERGTGDLSPPAPVTPHHSLPMKKIKTRARAKSPAESEIQNPCERFFIFIFSVYQNQIAEALPASKRTPTVFSQERDPPASAAQFSTCRLNTRYEG